MADISVLDYAKLLAPYITATGGIVVGAVKYALNGAKKQIAETHAEVKEMRNEVRHIDGRLIRVETKLDSAKTALDAQA